MFNSAPNETLNCTASPAFLDRQGDFEGVASRYSPVLFGIAFRRLRNVEDAEDAVQDALLSAYKHIGQFEGRSQLSSWLTRIVINTAGMKLRKRLRREVVSLDEVPVDGGATLADELAAAGPNPESICAQTETQAMVRRALAQISPKLRVAFQMREVGGYSTRETAKALGITTNTLKSRIRRARAAVGVYLENASGKRLAHESKALAASYGTSAPRQPRNLRRHRERFARSGRAFAGRPASFQGRGLSRSSGAQI
jgi:RNA polymerase sigma-70 factor (ECF subfamily)